MAPAGEGAAALRERAALLAASDVVLASDPLTVELACSVACPSWPWAVIPPPCRPGRGWRDSAARPAAWRICRWSRCCRPSAWAEGPAPPERRHDSRPAPPPPPPSSRLRRPWRTPLIALAIVVNASALGYRLTEGWDWGDCYWMVAITISTIGYGEVEPLSRAAGW